MADDPAQRNAQLISDFYAAFDRRDHAAMAAAYQPDATFTDPAFGRLEGPAVTGMWRMLCESAGDLAIESSDVQATATEGSARWEARYTFSATGRPVVNRIAARFRFRDGLIAEHVDDFSFWRWSSQALGPAGRLIGWTPLLRLAFQRRARGTLDAHLRGEQS